MKMIFYGTWLAETICFVAILYRLWREQGSFKFVPKRSLAFLRDIANSREEVTRTFDGAVFLGSKKQKGWRDLDDLETFGLIEKASDSLGIASFRITRDGYRALRAFEIERLAQTKKKGASVK